MMTDNITLILVALNRGIQPTDTSGSAEWKIK
jgi:hypothetical protein